MPISNTFVIAMGVGTVFISLICIVLLCKIMSLLCGAKKNEKKEEPAKNDVAPVQTVIPNRGEAVAAIAAAIAEELGTDVTGIRILSIKKI